MKNLTIRLKYVALRNEAHVEYNDTFLSTILRHTPETLGIQTLFEKYKNAFDTEIGGLDIVRKSEYTREINEQDIVRDRILRGFADAVKSALNHFDDSKKQAAERLDVVIKNYGNISEKTLDSETAAIDDLLREMNDNYSADVELLALGDWLTQLENENSVFKNLMEKRYEESAAKPSVIMKSARESTDRALRALLNQIDALALVNGEAEYEPLIKDLNVVSERYKNLLARGGDKKHYASIVTDGEVTVDDLVREIEKFSALSEPDIRGVIIALENVIQNKLAESKIVRLEKLGTFYPTLSSEGRAEAKEVTEHCIRRTGVNYRPGARILSAIKNAGFVKTA